MGDEHPTLPEAGTVTGLLRLARAGDQKALDQAVSRVYDDLKGLARAQIAQVRRDAELNATALVNQACERLLERDGLAADDRRHFLYILNRAMHDVLIERIRSDLALKRGGRQRRVAFDDDDAEAENQQLEMHLCDAIGELRKHDPRAAKLVELRFYGGHSLQDAAAILEYSFGTARRDWEHARAWLRERLTGR